MAPAVIELMMVMRRPTMLPQPPPPAPGAG
jgi:hypothetical protein